MKIDKFIIAVFTVTLLALAGGLYMVSNSGGTSTVEANENVNAVVEKTSQAWGNIGINDGNVEAEFEIKNEGSDTLKLSDVTTSCMCTTAQIITDEESPVFGMHTKSDYIAEVAPGESARLKVVFDPAFHGPSGVGPITRQVKMATNDPDNPEINYMLTANVTK